MSRRTVREAGLFPRGVVGSFMIGELAFPRPSGLRSGILDIDVLDLVDRFDWVELGVAIPRGL